jgi:hypothetical protein
MWKSPERIPTFPHAMMMELDVEGRFIEGAKTQSSLFEEMSLPLCASASKDV